MSPWRNIYATVARSRTKRRLLWLFFALSLKTKLQQSNKSRTSSRETLRSWENKSDCFPKGPVMKCIISHESRNSLWSPCRQHNLCDICVGPDGKALCDVMDCILIYSYTKRNHCDCEQGLLLPPSHTAPPPPSPAQPVPPALHRVI